MSERADDIVVRTAGQHDLWELARLWRSLRMEEAGSRDSETGADLSPFYELADRRSREPATILLIAYQGDQAVGFYCGRVQGRAGAGIDLYVRTEARRRGVGSRLLAVALTEYRERGADRIVGALRGDEGSHGFWESVWREHPSRLLTTRSASGVEWRTRSITAPRGSPPASRTRNSRPPSTP
jgi:GNAT superfamily N-acetyltransferase